MLELFQANEISQMIIFYQGLPVAKKLDVIYGGFEKNNFSVHSTVRNKMMAHLLKTDV